MAQLLIDRSEHLEMDGDQLVGRLVGITVSERAGRYPLYAHYARPETRSAVAVTERDRSPNPATTLIPALPGLSVLDCLHAGFEGAEIAGFQRDEERLCGHASTIADWPRGVGTADESSPQMRMARIGSAP